jgi:D-arginine dehydrogenase
MAALDDAWAELSPLGPPVHRLGTSETREIVPVVRPERVAASIFEPGAMDIDVHGLHGAYLRRARHRGCLIVTDVQVTALSCGAGSWTITTPVGDFVAPVVVNAAGAWADEVAGLAGLLPVGLVPKRRTAFIVAAPTGFDSRCWPLTGDIDETVYLKPDAGKLLVSPADETPIAPCDVQPEELDVARAIDRLMRDTIVEVRHVERMGGIAQLCSRQDAGRRFRPTGERFLLARRAGRLRDPNRRGNGQDGGRADYPRRLAGRYRRSWH